MLVSDRAAREMTNEEMDSFVKRAEDLYATQLKTALEAEHTQYRSARFLRHALFI